jgi:hypothetical protein
MYITGFILLSFAAGLGFDVAVNLAQDYSNEAGVDALWSAQLAHRGDDRVSAVGERGEFAVESQAALQRAIREQIDEVIDR